MSFLCHFIVELEKPMCFDICFGVNLGWLVFLSINFDIKFRLFSHSVGFESNFSDLDAESMVKVEANFDR